jgi:putative ABC transport system permease protein
MTRLWARLRAWRKRREIETERAEEMRSHLEMQARENMEAGMGADEARRAASRAFGGVDAAMERCRDQRGLGWMEDARADARHGARMLAKSPGFTATALLTLALGIGANTAIFSVVNAALLKPLPYPDEGRLVRIWSNFRRGAGSSRIGASPPDFRDWRAQAKTFENMAAYEQTGLNLTGHGDPVQLPATRATASLFPTLAIEPELGRVFFADAEKKGVPKTAVISHGLAERLFGGPAGATGQSLILDNRPFTVVGVMGPNFHFPDKDSEIWIPLEEDGDGMDNRGAHFLNVVGRLKPGVPPEQAYAEMRDVAKRLETEYSNPDWGVTLDSLRDSIIGGARGSALLLFGAALLTLAIACANLANLLLAKATAREKEMAIRAALGAKRARVIRQLMTESLLLALGGGILGVVAAHSGLRIAGPVIAANLPAAGRVEIDWRALGFALAASISVGAAFGLIPALHLSRGAAARRIKEGGRGHSSSAGKRARAILAIAQVALSLALLTGAGLLLRSFVALRSVPAGFSPGEVVTMQLALPELAYPQPARQSALISAFVDRVAALPGVEACGAATTLPLQNRRNAYSFGIVGREPLGGESWSAEHDSVTPGYFRAFGLSLVAGRLPDNGDGAEARKVMVINETAARRFFPGESPLGKLVTIASPDPAEIVGIVKDVRQYTLDQASPAHMYSPFAQKPVPGVALLIRSRRGAANLIADAKAALRELDRDLPLSDIATMDQIVSQSVAQRRTVMALAAGFSTVALLLASLGLYGLLSFSARQQAREIGIRVALGAPPFQVARMIASQGLRLTAIGLATGLVASLALTRLMASELFSIKPWDPETFLVVSALLLATAFAACWIPARRAAKADPMAALRGD